MHEKNKSSKRLTTDSGLSKYFVGSEVAFVQVGCVIQVYQDTPSYLIRADDHTNESQQKTRQSSCEIVFDPFICQLV